MELKNRMWCVVTTDGVKTYHTRHSWYDAVIRSTRKGIDRDRYATMDYVRLVWGYVLDQVVVAYKPPKGEEQRWGEMDIAVYDTEQEKMERWVQSVSGITPEE